MKQNILKILFVTAFVCLASRSYGADPAAETSAPAATGPEKVTFSLSGANYTFTVPEGFTVPSGKAGEVAANVASLDTANMTHVTFIPRDEAGNDAGYTSWGMLKTPRDSIGKNIPTRQEFLEQAKEGIKQGSFKEPFDDATKLAGKTYKDIFGEDAEIGMHMAIVSTDEYAAYVVGTASEDIGGKKKLTAMAGGMTVVRGNVFFYYKYALYTDLPAMAGLMKEVKVEIRRFVTDNPD